MSNNGTVLHVLERAIEYDYAVGFPVGLHWANANNKSYGIIN